MAVAYAAREGASLATLGGGTLTIANPGFGRPAGELLECYIICSANTTINPVESGWTNDVSAAGVRGYWRVTGASEPETYSFTRALQTNNIVGHIKRTTGAHPTAPIESTGAQSGGTGTTVVLPTLTVTVGFYLSMMGQVISNSTFTPPSGPTEDYDYQPATQAFAVFGGHEVVGAGATGTRTWTATNSGARSGVMRAIIAAPPVAGTASASGGGTASASGDRTVHATAAASGGGTATATGTVIGPVLGTALGSGGGTASAAGERTVHGTASATGGGTATATADRLVHATAAASGGGTATTVGERSVQGTASATGGGTATAIVTIVGAVQGTASASGGGAASATVTRVRRVTAAASGGGLTTATGLRILSGTGIAVGGGSATAVGSRTVYATATGIGGGTAHARVRIVVPTADSRRIAIASENRTNPIPADSTASTIPADRRTSTL